MATAYTSLLGLALPVTGELSGTWGDTVNNYITSYLDAAVEGTQTISGSQTSVTLSTTNGTSLSQAGSGATGSAQYAVINCTGNPASLLTITVPASSRQYIVINATSTSQSVKVVGVGPTTGVTIVSGEKAVIAWDGSDFVKVATSTGTGNVTASGNNAFTGANTFYNATGQTFGTATSTQDGIIIAGRAGGSSSYRVTLTPTTLSANRTLTLLDASTTVVGTDTTQTLTNKTIEAGTFTNGYTEEVATANTGTAYTIDLANGSVQILTLTGNCTFTFPTATAGRSFILLLKQDATGNRTATWPAAVKWPAATAPTITATASKLDKYVFTADGTNWYGSNAGQNYTV